VEPSIVRLKISNGPPASAQNSTTAVNGRGHGLAGMRERVTLLGGAFSAGPTAGGGFVVAAELPTGEPA
jgi:signal transduction histidine kinase